MRELTPIEKMRKEIFGDAYIVPDIPLIVDNITNDIQTPVTDVISKTSITPNILTKTGKNKLYIIIGAILLTLIYIVKKYV